MPASSKKKTSKSSAKKATKKSAPKKAVTKKAASKKKTTKAAAAKTQKKTKVAKKAATSKGKPAAKAAPAKAAPAKAAPAKAAPAKKAAKAPAKPGKPIRLDYLLEKLAEEYGDRNTLPPLADNLDLMLFLRLCQDMRLADANKAFLALRTQFVDWNEVRISPIEEVKDALKGAPDPGALGTFLQTFLMSLFLEQHHVGLEFVRDKTNAEIKAFFKKHPGFADSSLGLLLERVNDYPAVPLENSAMTFLDRVGLGSPEATPLARQKELYDVVPRDQVFELSLLIHEHARYTCPASDDDLDCPDCALKRGCPFPAKVTPRQRAAAKKNVKKSK